MTAKEMFDKMLLENDEATSTEMMIEFAKYHVQKALKEIGEIVDNELEKDFLTGELILNSYNLDNIK